MRILGDAAFPHARALYDPLVAGLDHLLEHRICEHKIRQAGACANEFTVDDFHAPQNFKSLSPKAWKSDNSLIDKVISDYYNKST